MLEMPIAPRLACSQGLSVFKRLKQLPLPEQHSADRDERKQGAREDDLAGRHAIRHQLHADRHQGEDLKVEATLSAMPRPDSRVRRLSWLDGCAD